MKYTKITVLLLTVLFSTTSCNIPSILKAGYRSADDLAKATARNIPSIPTIKPKPIEVDYDKFQEEIKTYIAENFPDVPEASQELVEDFQNWREKKKEEERKNYLLYLSKQ